MTIYISTSCRGVTSVATCHFDERTFTEEGRTIANALSNLCSRLGRVKGAAGQDWSCPDEGLKGVIGGSTKRKARRGNVSSMPSFQLIGGQMND